MGWDWLLGKFDELRKSFLQTSAQGSSTMKQCFHLYWSLVSQEQVSGKVSGHRKK